MNRDVIEKLTTTFESAVHKTEDDTEFWFARELQVLLEYTEWRNFLLVIEKAKTACETAGYQVSDHFVDVNKMVKLGSGSERSIDDVMLTRYACYLIAQNGDPKKQQIAFAQTYFAVQTRKQEILEERIMLAERLKARKKLSETETELSQNIFERGVDGKGFARIRSKGDEALFGGYTTSEMKERLGIPDNRPLADFLPTITIKAKDLATEITNFNVKKDNLNGEVHITKEHIKNNKDVRALLGKSDIKPENLPAEEDLKKLERRLNSEEKRSIKNTKKLKIKTGGKNIQM